MKKSTTDRRIGQLKLDLPGSKPVEISFDGEDVSANGGALLVAQVEKLTGLIAGVASRLTDHRTESLIKHNYFEQVAQRVLQIIAGLPAGSDSDFLRADPILKLAVGRNPITGNDLSSQPTQQRLESNRSFKELYKLCQWLVDYYIQCQPRPPKSITLDFDGSAIETYGLQLNAFYRSGPYGKFMYFPLFVFDQNGWLLVAALRPGDDGEVALSLPVLKRLVARLRAAWPNVAITVRADGAFTAPEFYQWMDDNRVQFVLGLKHNNVLLTYSKAARQAARKKFVRAHGQPRFTGKGGKKRKLAAIKAIRSTADAEARAKAQRALNSRKVRVFADFSYGAATWDRKRRVICRIDFNDEEISARYIVTNINSLTAAQVYERIYCMRARVEHWIKNIKETNCNRMSCSQFKANMFRLLLHAFAYVLICQVMKTLPQQLGRISVEQFRRRFFVVAVHVVERKHSVHVRVSASYADAHEFRLAAKRLGAHSLLAA